MATLSRALVVLRDLAYICVVMSNTSHPSVTQSSGGNASTVWIRTVPSKSFTDDDVVQAWEKGKQDGVSELIGLAVDQLEKNMKAAFAHTKEVINIMTQFGIEAVGARLRLDTWNRLKVIILVPASSMDSGNIYKLYDEISAIESREQSDRYCITFSLLADGETLNKSRLVSDGYIREFNAEA